ncbi:MULTISPECIES: hypothetical protein [unclassified Rathayibacter]|uniref:hypothetical protein n=1 Tax=unclassified Rathayibacter TaxID=2609250 RepID=UPI0007004DDE|nr:MULTISPECIES: hypothetical protein [unclassified Rathayibacter]KQQ05139.1 hypothetical protein ASF42_00490 [Rathayibacter sp. Leaf294]KQS13002.1 hypothetical protein ASG06_00490 [Rathayibacter sp. Leaf185]
MSPRVGTRSAVTVRLVRWYRTDEGWASEIVHGRLLEHHGGVWRLLDGAVTRDYPDTDWSLCHE